MEAKKDLARRIVTDFHSADAAAKAAEDWAKQFQKDEMPEDVEEVECTLLTLNLRRDGLSWTSYWRLTGLADSVSDAGRKLKQNAVRVNGEVDRSHRSLECSKRPDVAGGEKNQASALHAIILSS